MGLYLGNKSSFGFKSGGFQDQMLLRPDSSSGGCYITVLQPSPAPVQTCEKATKKNINLLSSLSIFVSALSCLSICYYYYYYSALVALVHFVVSNLIESNQFSTDSGTAYWLHLVWIILTLWSASTAREGPLHREWTVPQSSPNRLCFILREIQFGIRGEKLTQNDPQRHKQQPQHIV